MVELPRDVLQLKNGPRRRRNVSGGMPVIRKKEMDEGGGGRGAGGDERNEITGSGATGVTGQKSRQMRKDELT